MAYFREIPRSPLPFRTRYTSSPHATWSRFRATGFALIDWFEHPLDDAWSEARRAVRVVRAMHARARAACERAGTFRRKRGEGVALSQYDLAEVRAGRKASEHPPRSFHGLCRRSVLER